MTTVMSLSDVVRLRSYRKAGILKRLAQRYLAGIVLFNPVNIRYVVMRGTCRSMVCTTRALMFF